MVATGVGPLFDVRFCLEAEEVRVLEFFVLLLTATASRVLRRVALRVSSTVLQYTMLYDS